MELVNVYFSCPMEWAAYHGYQMELAVHADGYSGNLVEVLNGYQL